MQFLKNIRLRLTDSTKYVKLFPENLCGKQMKQKAETFLRILGIDPGLATMGWGVIEADGYREKLVQYGALITYPRDTFPTRLRCIYTGVQGLLQTFKPDEIAFEELFFSKNVTTGIQVGGARGVALVACQAYTDKLFEYTPMQIKQAVVGYGGADKHQVQMMVRMLAMGETKLFGMCTLITLGIFCVIYGLVYAFTAKSYYNIVRVKA